jgi:hypothetical protein
MGTVPLVVVGVVATVPGAAQKSSLFVRRDDWQLATFGTIDIRKLV